MKDLQSLLFVEGFPVLTMFDKHPSVAIDFVETLNIPWIECLAFGYLF